MKIIGNSMTVIAVLICAAVLLVPMANARDSGATATLGQGGPGNGDMSQMQVPPSGNTENENSQDVPGTGGNTGGEGSSRAPPSGGQDAGQGHGMGNMTGHAPPAREFGNITSRHTGSGNDQGFENMTRQAPPSGEFGNATVPGAIHEGMQGFGNMTPPERPSGEMGNITPKGNGQGMGNMTVHSPHGGEFANSTVTGNGPGAWQGNANVTLSQEDNNPNPAGQKSAVADNQDIIVQIKALLAKLF